MAKVSAITTSIQHHVRGPSQWNKTRQKNYNKKKEMSVRERRREGGRQKKSWRVEGNK